MKKWFLNIWTEMKTIQSTPKELREFGWVMGGFFLILAGIGFWRHKNFLPFVSISGIFFVITYLNPLLLKPLQKAWMAFAVVIGYFMTRLILILLFFLAVTPLSLLSRLFGKKFISLHFSKEQAPKSYWIHKPDEPFNKEHYERQF